MILIMTGKQTFFMYKKRENYHVFRSKVSNRLKGK